MLRRWNHRSPGQRLAAGDGLHWTGVYKTWNSRCAECHATGYEKRYDARTRRFNSRQAEIGVGCEACHGPGSAHLAWTEGTTPPAGVGPTGFSAQFSATNAEAEIQQCAECHARREAFLDGNPQPGTAFADAFRLCLLREGRRLDCELSRAVLTDAERERREIDVDLTGLLRGHRESRWAAHKIAIETGVLDADDIRRMEGFNSPVGSEPNAE